MCISSTKIVQNVCADCEITSIVSMRLLCCFKKTNSCTNKQTICNTQDINKYMIDFGRTVTVTVTEIGL